MNTLPDLSEEEGGYTAEHPLQTRLLDDIARYVDGDSLLLDASELNRATLGETESGVRQAVKEAFADRYLRLKGQTCDIDRLFPVVELKAVEVEAAAEVAVADYSKPLRLTEFPHLRTKTDKDGNVFVTGLLSTIENLEHMLNGYGIKLRYNEMTRLREVVVPGVSFSEDNADERALDTLENLAVLNGMGFGGRMSGAVSCIAEKDRYHPVRQWIESKKWDGVSRLQALCDTLAVATDDLAAYRNRIVTRWLISGVAALYSQKPTDKFELVLTLQGYQGKGKTSWFMRLVEAAFGAVMESNAGFDPGNKDHVFTAAAHFIVELGEIDSTFSKSEMGKLKAYLSATKDRARRPYGKVDSNLKRRTIFGGSVNRPDCLIDDENRRFLMLQVIGVDYQHNIEMQQLWAEIKEEYFDKKVQHWLTDAERAELDRANERFEAAAPVVELLNEGFEFPTAGATATLPRVESGAGNRIKGTFNITATQVAVLFNLPRDRKTVGECSSALRKLTGEDWTKSNGQKVWRVMLRPKSQYRARVIEVLGLDIEA
ncbi:MAG: hypothetical protein JSR75_19555 [Proteobacteria bacterium]|nr:hypothetical protein [Pseudomonadota bacterium]